VRTFFENGEREVLQLRTSAFFSANFGFPRFMVRTKEGGAKGNQFSRFSADVFYERPLKVKTFQINVQILGKKRVGIGKNCDESVGSWSRAFRVLRPDLPATVGCFNN